MPFCKICFDLGRSDFDKHNVRDSARNTTCLYLLNTECKNCQCFGHTVTYCNMPRHTMPRPNNRVVAKNTPTRVPPINICAKNAFECLQCDDVNKDNDNFHPDGENQFARVNIPWGKSILNNKTWADVVEEEENENNLKFKS